MRPAIEITRFWIDAAEVPHREVAQVIRVGVNSPRGQVLDMGTIEGVASAPVPSGRVRIVTVVDPAVDQGPLAVNLNALYALPLRLGARLLTEAAWVEAVAARRATDQAASTQLAVVLAAQQAAADEAARAALVAGLGITDGQIASSVAAYMALNPPAGPSTQQIATAVAAHLQAYPPPAGRPPTQTELLAAVTLYVAANADQLRGPAGATGGIGATGAQGAAGTPADPAALANLQAQLTLLMASYNAGVEVRVEQVLIPLLALGASATRTVTWTPAFTTGRTVVVDVHADTLVGKATLEVVGTPTVTSVDVKISAALAVTATTGIVIGISRKAAT